MNTNIPKKCQTSTDLGLLNRIIVMLGEIDRATEIERFPTCEDITVQLEAIRNSGDRIINLHAELVSMVTKAQNNCGHVFRSVAQFDDSYRFARPEGSMVLSEQICDKCKLVKIRPKATPFEICYMCWSPMKEKTRAFGSINNFYYYECTNINCRHQITRP